jgi:hypothetical protein
LFGLLCGLSVGLSLGLGFALKKKRIPSSYTMCEIAPIEMARLMRGKVPEWDETYIETYIPAPILGQLLEKDKWIDEEGFHWGFCYV